MCSTAGIQHFLLAYSCSRSSCSRKDRTTGCLSAATSSLNGVRFLVPLLPPSPSPPSSTSLCSVNTMSRSMMIRSSSGTLDCPKHNPDTTSMKNVVQLFLMADSNFFSSLLLNIYKQVDSRHFCVTIFTSVLLTLRFSGQ